MSNRIISSELPEEWWKDAVVYQIYTRSFQDSNGDGIGDFQGVRSRLDHLEKLGVDVIWLSPFCDSPNDDNGYDISDYYSVHPEFGTMEDFVELVDDAHSRGMKIMMDLVMNHTSDEHAWFRESRSSRENPKRDWYIWRQANADGSLPNNWRSYFGGSAWEFDENTGEYYLHCFSTKQPDLNWSNPEVRNEMYRIAEFWINKGVNAFRLDAVHHIGKPPGLPDYPEPRKGPEIMLYKNLSETHTYLQEMHDRVFAPHKIFTVGETGGTSTAGARLYVDRDRGELNMIHHFEQFYMKDPGDAGEMQRNQRHWFRHLSKKGWDARFFSNHDLPRQVSAFGNDREYREKSATAIAALLLTSWGTPFIYQGEEIGMANFPYTDISQFRDRHGLQGYNEALERGEDSDFAWAELVRRNRDNSRTPMQWSGSLHGGFSTAEPWIELNPDYNQINVESQIRNPQSILQFYSSLLEIRSGLEVLRRGDFRVVSDRNRDVLAFFRRRSREWTYTLINWSDRVLEYRIPRSVLKAASVGSLNALIWNYRDYPETGPKPDAQRMKLRPYEAMVFHKNP